MEPRVNAPPPVRATLTLAELSARVWDALVIGGGPAGALAARELAKRGLAVALLDKSGFPRDKVCGGCLSPPALAALRSCGLGELPARLGGVPLADVQFSYEGRHARLPLRGGVAVSRRALDAALVREAIASGAGFLPGHAAVLGQANEDHRGVVVGPVAAAARVVLVADGLGGRSLAGCGEFALAIDARERVGVGGLFAAGDDWPAGRVHLAGVAGGYIGIVRVEDGLLDVAGALTPELLRACGGTERAIARILREARLPALPPGGAARWRGTPALARRRFPVAVERVFVIGDAAGYVEPFTGEGIGWALESALAVAPLAQRGARAWHPALASQWRQRHGRTLRRQQMWCRLFRRMLWEPVFTRIALRVVARVPAIGRFLLGATHRAGRDAA